jgi:FixJ family two-component response regulator
MIPERLLQDEKMSAVPTISIVDDDPWAREGIKELVESLGYSARTFVSAEHFLDSGFVAHTKCLITDLQMPGLSGLELQKNLLARGYQIPVILITAYPNEEQRTYALGAGAIGFLHKPFDELALINYLALAVSRHDDAADPA